MLLLISSLVISKGCGLFQITTSNNSKGDWFPRTATVFAEGITGNAVTKLSLVKCLLSSSLHG